MLAPFIAALMLTAGQAATQSPEPQTIGPEQLKAAIDRLGAFDAKERTASSVSER